MDTPERTLPALPPPPPSQPAGTPGPRVENSPVFNFINNLSPIKPVKSLRITQSFQTLSFPSIPSIFSSPHADSQKERKFVLRPHITSSKSDNGDKLKQSTGPLNISKPLDSAIGHKYSCISHPPIEANDFLAHDYPVQNIKPCQSLQYDCGSPNHNAAPFYGTESIDTKLDLCSALSVDYVPDELVERENCIKSDFEADGSQYLRQDNGAIECKWEDMISEDAGNLLILDSCMEGEVSLGDPEILEQGSTFSMIVPGPSEESLRILQTTQAGESSESCIRSALQDSLGNLEDEGGEQNLSGQVSNVTSANGQSEISNQMKVGTRHQRGMLRRCLQFDMAGANKKNTCIEMRKIPTVLSCQVKNSSEDEPSSPKTGACPLSCALPSIGLHLNSLASTSKDRLFQRDVYPSEKGQISTPNSVFPSFSALYNEMPSQVSTSTADCQSVDSEEQGLPVNSEISLVPESQKGEEILSSSPKKKKRKLDSNVEIEGCKRCNCKKSKCLKLYCECFAAGVYCVEPCSCQGCLNKPTHEDTVLATRKLIESRNPIAFAPKVIRPLEPASEVGQEEANKTPASARHKRGCNCKKSGCLKKYCECFQGGAGCSFNCRCEGCKNPFGTKFGKLPVNNEEIENGSEGMDSCDMDCSKLDHQQIANIQIGDQHNPESLAPITPSFPTLRLSGKPPFPSTGKPPRSTVLVIGSSPRLNAFKALKKPETTPSHSMSMEHSFAVTIDETPDILKINATSQIAIKISSPSRKRISPPHNETAPSPSRKGSRKLILKSIPSFPSLVSETINDESSETIAADLLISPQLD